MFVSTPGRGGVRRAGRANLGLPLRAVRSA
jgi:hypothetical protein